MQQLSKSGSDLEKKLYLRYTDVISDGDAKTVSSMNKSEPCGLGVIIVWHKCVGHVQKPVGNKIRLAKKAVCNVNHPHKDVIKSFTAELKTLKDRHKAQGKSIDRGKKKDIEIKKLEVEIERVRGCLLTGSLSDKTIDLLQLYYSNATRAHSSDLEGMKRAWWAVFYHSVSTDANPQHQDCPGGTDSWCKHQRALALHQDMPPHHTTITKGFEPYLKDIFKSLCGEELRKKYLMGATQNRNQSLNKLIWARAPKTEFASLAAIEVAVSLAIANFNSGGQGVSSIMKSFGVQAGLLCNAYLASRDVSHLKKNTGEGDTGVQEEDKVSGQWKKVWRRHVQWKDYIRSWRL